MERVTESHTSCHGYRIVTVTVCDISHTLISMVIGFARLR